MFLYRKFYYIFRITISLPFLLPHIFLFYLKDDKITKDIARWSDILEFRNKRGVTSFLKIIIKCKEFRNLFYFRHLMILKSNDHPIFKKIIILPNYIAARLFLKELPTLYIGGDIGGGLFIQHGFASMIQPEKMGENCIVAQQVTIGCNNGKSPVIGNNVRISAGTIVIGGIKIGDNSEIGPNSLVIRNIPANSTAVSQPSYIVKKDGKWLLEKIESFDTDQ